MANPSPLEKLRRELALAVGENAVFDGWSRTAVDSAASELGIDAVQARLAMSKSQTGMIDLYIQEVDRALEAYFTPKRLAGMKVREKIRSLIWRRLEIMAPAREAVPSAGDPCNAAKSSAGTEDGLANGGRDVANRGRHEHGFQPLYEADDARRGLRLDAAGLAR